MVLGLVCSMLLAMTGCKDKQQELPKEELPKYVTLGEYKGLTYTEVKAEVTDAELKEAIEKYMFNNPITTEVTDRAVQNGDTVSIDFVGRVDGETFEGGTARGYSLLIGSGSMIDGFEEGIVGMMPGETKAVDTVFPEQYRPEGVAGSELNGKAATFDITVNHIVETKYPEYNDEYVQEHTSYNTTEEFEESMINSMIASKKEEAETAKLDELFGKLVENATIHELPKVETNKYYSNMIDSYTSMAESVGLELEDFLTQYYGVTMETLENYASEYAELMATQAVVFQAIAEAESITVTEEEKQQAIDEYFASMGSAYESKEEFEKEMSTLIAESLLYEKVEQFVVDHAVAVPAEEVEQTEESTEE